MDGVCYRRSGAGWARASLCYNLTCSQVYQISIAGVVAKCIRTTHCMLLVFDDLKISFNKSSLDDLARAAAQLAAARMACTLECGTLLFIFNV